MRRDDFDGLAVFLSVARHGGFSAAATRLGVSTSAVSQAIRQLEERLGTPLFNRTTRSVALTEAGRELLEGVRPATDEIAATLDTVRGLGSRPSGLLRLNLPRAALPWVIEPVLAEFIEAHPELQVEIGVDDALVDIVAAGYDAGVRLGSMVEAEMVGVPLTPPMRSVVVGAPAYFARRGRPETPADLTEHACIRYRLIAGGGIYRWELSIDGRETPVAVDGPLIVNDIDLLLRAALDGVGLAYLYDTHIREHEQAGRLERVLEPYSLEEPGLYLYFPRRAERSRKLRAFIDFVRPRLRRLHGGP